MTPTIRELVGSKLNDAWKRLHKNLPAGGLYLSDVDVVYIARYPTPHIAGFADIKRKTESVTWAECVAYNALKAIAPVYIIQDYSGSGSGPFLVSCFSSGDPDPDPPVVVADPVCFCQDWPEYETFELWARRAAPRQWATTFARIEMAAQSLKF